MGDYWSLMTEPMSGARRGPAAADVPMQVQRLRPQSHTLNVSKHLPRRVLSRQSFSAIETMIPIQRRIVQVQITQQSVVINSLGSSSKTLTMQPFLKTATQTKASGPKPPRSRPEICSWWR
jgi:hypothetical protein